MYIDSLPVTPLVDSNGNVTEGWRNHFEQVIRQIQTFLSNERYMLPHQPAPRSVSQEIAGLDTQQNLGGTYYHPTSNNSKVNLKVYSATAPTAYQFKPQVSYHSVSNTADRDAIPAAESEGKLLTTTDDNTKAYLWVNNAWRTITLT